MTRFDATIAAPRYIPFERRVLALDDFSNGPIFVKRGSAHDLGDPIVRAAPQMFRELDGRPVRTHPGASAISLTEAWAGVTIARTRRGRAQDVRT